MTLGLLNTLYRIGRNYRENKCKLSINNISQKAAVSQTVVEELTWIENGLGAVLRKT